MVISTLWATRVSDDGPELLAAWDQWSIEGNWEGWAAECRRQLDAMGNDLDQYRYFNLSVDLDKIEDAFRQRTLPAVVTPAENPEAI